MDTNLANPLFTKAFQAGASDVHIASGSPILFRIDGMLVAQTQEAVTPIQAEHLVHACLEDAAFERFKKEKELDASYELRGGIRLRINCHFQRGTMSLAARIIPAEIPSLESLGLTELADKFRVIRQGLILFTGPTGTGKSTSLASLIQAINTERAANIITLEDPIEFVFPPVKSLMRQREYGFDFLSFPEGLKHVLRQDPDIVMVGEMRDPETIAAALTLAETGHLIFATLHTPNTVQTVDRIIDVFSPHQQGQIRSQLSMSLQAIVAQRLVPRKDGGRIALREVLFNIPAVANIIRESRAQELTSVLQTNEAVGMYTFEKCAKRFLREGKITKEVFEAVTAVL